MERLSSLSSNLSWPKVPQPALKPNHVLVAGTVAVATLGAFAVIRSVGGAHEQTPSILASPAETVLSEVPPQELEELPYPPNAMPGARDVESPYGRIRVNEWGPESGQRVLLIHGISTPSLALAEIGRKLAKQGCRVMLFDLFGRGHSSGPSPEAHHYDSGLYAAQIFFSLQSSPIAWTSFILVGYSLGGAIAADFTSYFPNLIRGLVLVAPGGLIRTSHVSVTNKLLYSARSPLPGWLVNAVVASRLRTGPEATQTVEPEADIDDNVSIRSGSTGHAIPAVSSRVGLLRGNPLSTIQNVAEWQVANHRGFVPAFISSIRYAPVHEQHHRWRVIAQNIDKRVGKLKKVYIVLGETDPIIIADELVEDAKEVLGEKNVRIKLLKGVGHEVAIDRANDIVVLVKGLLK